MNHQEAARLMAVEKYLLNELAPPVRDQFEEHFFECQECAMDLRATSAFLDSAKKELQRGPVKTVATPRRSSWFADLFRPSFVAPAFAVLLLLIGYQNMVVYPRLTSDMALSGNPEVLPAVSLVAGNSRGGAEPSVTVENGKSILVSLDVPTREKFSSYDLALISPSGAPAWHVQISAEQARDTVSIRIPTAHWAAGEYSLNVRGQADGTTSQPEADLAQYRFKFNSSK